MDIRGNYYCRKCRRIHKVGFWIHTQHLSSACSLVVMDARKGKLEELFHEALPFYNSDYEKDWTMDRLVARILEICDGKK